MRHTLCAFALVIVLGFASAPSASGGIRGSNLLVQFLVDKGARFDTRDSLGRALFVEGVVRSMNVFPATTRQYCFDASHESTDSGRSRSASE